ncbi:patatin-like phospholipase family protein [Candidatus Nitrosocosmicus sp. R]
MDPKDIPFTQRALVLQGGGALGAYQLGVLKVLCNKVAKESKNRASKDAPLFDVIAGTSIGAINAAVLIGNVVNRNKTWEQALEELENFWTDEVKGVSSTPDLSRWWWTKHNPNFSNMISVSKDALTKYYSVKEYLKHGTPNVCWPQIPEYDSKFGDLENIWFVNSSAPLQDTIERYAKQENSKELRIATNWDRREPRLLVVSVDIAEGKTTTFDSYHRKSKDPKNSAYEGDGIDINHIMASGTIPIFYKFRKIKGHQFCDGGILSNTPFRELLQAHYDYWTSIAGEDSDRIPDLEVYIINLHPSKITIDSIPHDYDGIKDRVNDIVYSDRNSHYTEMVTDLVTDYRDLIDKLIDLTKSYVGKEEINAFENKFEKLINKTKAKSKTHTGRDRTYKDLLKGRFRLTKVIRIEPKSYDNPISGKGSDFTSITIKDLIKKGEHDAKEILN